MSNRPAGSQSSGANLAAHPVLTEATTIVAELRTANRLLAVLATKGIEQRHAIVLLDSVGFQPTQIAAILGMSPNATRVALHRARKAAQASASGEFRTKEHRDGDE